jgi:hypothetical protein
MLAEIFSQKNKILIKIGGLGGAGKGFKEKFAKEHPDTALRYCSLLAKNAGSISWRSKGHP